MFQRLLICFLTFFSYALIASDVVFISSSPGPSEHFAMFAKAIERSGHTPKAFVLETFKRVFEKEDLPYTAITKDKLDDFTHAFLEERDYVSYLEEMFEVCANNAICIITEGGTTFSKALHTAFSKLGINQKSLVYYDNPEPYVSGGYSKLFSETLSLPIPKVLFSNKALAASDIYNDNMEPIIGGFERRGIGFFPFSFVHELMKCRDSSETIRTKVLSDLNIEDSGQKIVTFIGTLGETFNYYGLGALRNIFSSSKSSEDLSDFLILYQQHPRAAMGGDADLGIINLEDLQEKGIAIYKSPLDILEALCVSEAALYFESSVIPRCILAGIPTVNISSKQMHDHSIELNITKRASDLTGFVEALTSLERSKNLHNIERYREAMGIDMDWEYNLLEVINEYNKLF